MLVLTNDTFTFAVPDGVAAKCATLRDAPASDAPVPLPNVSSFVMARIVQFHMRVAELEQAGTPPDDAQAWKASWFATMARTELFAVMESANYLGATDMLDDACEYVRGLIKGRTPEQIRELFMMPTDQTAEEARQAAEELAWALK